MMKFFDNEAEARKYMRLKNKVSLKDIFCLVDGPENNYAVVDLKTAIELDVPYEWSAR